MINETLGIQQLAEKLWYLPNFLTKEEVDKFNKILEDKSNESLAHPFDVADHGIINEVPELFDIWEKLSDVLYPTHVMHPQLQILHFKEGGSMQPHWDSPGEGHHDDLTLPDRWCTCCLLDYGVCVYFGDYTGGEVYYPKLQIEVEVKPGDLIIHGALQDYEHGVKVVKSGTRYTYSNFALKAEKNPGTFPNYKTKEYYECTKTPEDRKNIWSVPKFNDPITSGYPEAVDPYL
jgi:hypothetical protein